MKIIKNPCYLTREGKAVPITEWKSGSKFGLAWQSGDGSHRMHFQYSLGIRITPLYDAFVMVFPKWPAAPFQLPNNAAIYNADGSLRCQLFVPKVLTPSLPGTTLTAEDIKRMPPDGFWEIGTRVNEFGDVCDWLAPYLMWANIGYGYDTYECRYFDPTTGVFDTEHFSAGRL